MRKITCFITKRYIKSACCKIIVIRKRKQNVEPGLNDNVFFQVQRIRRREISVAEANCIRMAKSDLVSQVITVGLDSNW